MAPSRDFEAEVLKRLLTAVDADSLPAESTHLDDETLALFAEGVLASAERDAAVEHLAVCADCRRVSSLLLSHLDEPDVKVTLTRPGAWISPPMMAWATAAMLLVAAVGVYFSRRSPSRSGEGPASQVASGGSIPTTRKDGAQPPEKTRDERLATTAPKQPASRPPNRPPIETLTDGGSPGKADNLANAIALASAGRLTDYGYGLEGGGFRTREWSPAQVKSLESLPEGQDLTSLLNRGQLFLKFNHAKRATESFADATERFPQSSLAWLGLGLAHYVDNDLAAAAKDFRMALELDPKGQAARFNLAMTLETQHDRDGALQVWKALLQEQLMAADRENVRQRIKALEADQAGTEKKK
jgi:hypothetical protein